MHIGLDLDNTLINYDGVFGPVGCELGLLSYELATAGKATIREYFRAQSDGERRWMQLQGQVYGRYIDRALLFDGVAEFLSVLREEGATFSVVSHKTRFGHYDPLQLNLWDAARGWLEMQGLFEVHGLDRDGVFFEETRAGKLARISQLGCDLFIDDLPEVLLDPAFPRATIPIWFAGAVSAADSGGLRPHRDWQEVRESALRAGSTKPGGRRQ